jgi:hypothetical protein
VSKWEQQNKNNLKGQNDDIKQEKPQAFRLENWGDWFGASRRPIARWL